MHLNENEALVRMEQMTEDLLGGADFPTDLSSLDPVFQQFNANTNARLIEAAVVNTVLLLHKGKCHNKMGWETFEKTVLFETILFYRFRSQCKNDRVDSRMFGTDFRVPQSR